MVAFVEYDKATYQWSTFQIEGPVPPPFATDAYSLTEGYGCDWGCGLYTGSKDYLFFGAIAGVRNESAVDPLHSPRGLPSNPSLDVRRAAEEGVFEGGFGTGWLTPGEIHAALDHQAVNRDLLSFETGLILEIMASLERRLGVGRVRLIFTFH